MIPRRIKVVTPADRGFGRTALAAFCQRQGFGYPIRIRPSVTARLKGFGGKLLGYPVNQGVARVLKRVSYRSDQAVTRGVVVRWRKDLPEKRDECRLLMTGQPGTAHQLTKLNGRRMPIEQRSRDGKNKRNGRGLRDTKTTKPQRLDRLPLVPAVAYPLRCGVGPVAGRHYKPSEWCSTNRDIECGVFTIGLIMPTKIKASPPAALRAVPELPESVAPNWG